MANTKSTMDIDLIATSSETDQAAGAVFTIEKQGFWTTAKWFGIAIILAVFNIISFLFIRHKNYEQ